MYNRFIRWFNEHSLRFKLTSIFLLVLMVTQVFSGVLMTNVVGKKLQEDLLLSNQNALTQMAANADEVLMNIVEDLYPVLSLTRRNHTYSAPIGQEGGADTAYATNSIEYQDFFNGMVASRNNYRYIHSMLVLGEEEVYSYTNHGYSGLNGEDLYRKVYVDYEHEGPQYIWTGFLDTSYYFSGGGEQIVSLVVPVRLYAKTKGFVVLNLSVPRLQSYIADMAGENGVILLQIAPQDLIASDAEAEELTLERSRQALGQMDREGVEPLGEQVLLTTRLVVNNWMLSMLYSEATADGAELLLRSIIPLLVGVGLVMMASSGLIVGEVTKPLRKLTTIMRENTKSRSKELRFNAQYSDEVGVLGMAYNQMMDDLEQEQHYSRTTYMKMLQMQIKPHFLYNSMESTRFLVEMGDKKSVDMIRAIVTYYKLSLSGVDEVVAIREEIEHLDCYLEILQIRYSSRYEYSIEVEDGVLGDEIEKFALQPLVENAVYHGIKLKRGKGLIRIRGWREGQKNIIEIWDNGIGIPQDRLEELTAKMGEATGPASAEHIGVLNVHQRLRMRYGNGYGLAISSVEGQYTSVQVSIPSIGFTGAADKEENQDD